MTLAVTVTPVPSLAGYRLTASGAVGTIDWWRDEGGAADVFLGNGASVLDRSVPLNIPVTYYATDDSTLAVAPPVTMAADYPILASTTRSAAMRVTVISFRPYSGEGRSVWHPILGRNDPYVTIHPALYPAGDLVLRCETNTDRTNVIALLSHGDPLLLRTTCPPRLDTMTFLMIRWSDPFPDDTRREGPTHLRVQYQRVTDVPPAWEPSPDWTYGALQSSGRTYQQTLDDFDTYQNLADGVVP